MSDKGYLDKDVTIEQELAKYVALRVRLGDRLYTFADALKEHRRAALQNYNDEENDDWRVRIEGLDRLADARRIDLRGQPTLAQVTAAIAGRARMVRQRDVEQQMRGFAEGIGGE